MKLTKIEKVIAQLEGEKADAQRRCSADVAVLDLAIKKIRAAQSAAPKRVPLAKAVTATIQAAKPAKKSLHDDRDTRSEEA